MCAYPTSGKKGFTGLLTIKARRRKDAMYFFLVAAMATNGYKVAVSDSDIGGILGGVETVVDV